MSRMINLFFTEPERIKQNILFPAFETILKKRNATTMRNKVLHRMCTVCMGFVTPSSPTPSGGRLQIATYVFLYYVRLKNFLPHFFEHYTLYVLRYISSANKLQIEIDED